MNQNIKRIIALTLTISAFSGISAITPGTKLDISSELAYAASYSPDDGELKSLKIKSLDGETLELRDGYNGKSVKLDEEKEYYTKLTDDSEGIEINAKAEDGDYIVKIFTSDKDDAEAFDPGDEILLGKGDTTIYIRTYESKSAFRNAKDRLDDVSICEEEYTLNVRKTTESSYEDNTQDPIYLDKIDVSRGEISYLKQKTDYKLKVDKDIDSIKVTAEPEDDNDRVRINGTLVDSDDDYKKTISLDEGDNEIKIKVTDSKDNQRTYVLNVTRGDSSDTQDEIYLDELNISEGEIDFSQDETSYDVDLDESVSKITIGAEPEDEDYLVTIDGDVVYPDDDYEKKVSLDKGENIIKVLVEDEVNDKERTYTLTINRGDAVEDDEDKDTDTDTDTSEEGSGWVKTDDGWKYNYENGASLKDSWLFDNDKKVYYYLNSDGIRETGWVEYRDVWYLLDKEGVMLTGWQQEDKKWYMLDENGAMITGWYKEEATAESTSSENAEVLTETKITDPSNDTTKTGKWYYLNEDGSMRIGWLLIKDKWYFFNLNGTMQRGWLINSNSKYYLNEEGTMVTGDKTIDGKEYKFTSNGVLIL